MSGLPWILTWGTARRKNISMHICLSWRLDMCTLPSWFEYAFSCFCHRRRRGGEEDVGSTFAFMTQKKWMCEEEGDYFFLRSTKKGGGGTCEDRAWSIISFHDQFRHVVVVQLSLYLHFSFLKEIDTADLGWYSREAQRGWGGWKRGSGGWGLVFWVSGTHTLTGREM